jgi:anaphase-promoting complex subunit 10
MVDAEARGASPRCAVSRFVASSSHRPSIPARHRAADASARILADDPAPPPPSGDPADTSEIGRLAVWSVTSAKPGNGVELLRDGNLDTYWQSDGAQPHLVNVQFQRKVKVREIALYADYKLDESYTPSKISVRAGNSFHDLREVCVVDLDEPVGWTRVRLDANGGGETEMDAEGGAPLRAYFLQLAVLSNHQNGRDTHVRQVKIFGPRQSPMAMLGNGVSFTTTEFAQFATVR